MEDYDGRYEANKNRKLIKVGSIIFGKTVKLWVDYTFVEYFIYSQYKYSISTITIYICFQFDGFIYQTTVTYDNILQEPK